MGLEHRHDPAGQARQRTAAALQHQPRHDQGGGHLTGVVGIVVHHLAAVPVAAEIKAAAGGLQAGHRLPQRSEGHPFQAAGRQGGGSVAEIVAPGEGQLQAAHQGSSLVEVHRAAVAALLRGDGGEIHPHW